MKPISIPGATLRRPVSAARILARGPRISPREAWFREHVLVDGARIFKFRFTPPGGPAPSGASA